jgi:hypothetical protein
MLVQQQAASILEMGHEMAAVREQLARMSSQAPPPPAWPPASSIPQSVETADRLGRYATPSANPVPPPALAPLSAHAQLQRLHQLLNGGAQIPAFAVSGTLKELTQALKLAMLAEDADAPKVMFFPAEIRTHAGRPAAIQLVLTAPLVQHLGVGSWGPQGVSLAALGAAPSSSSDLGALERDIEHLGGIPLSPALTISVLSSQQLSKRPPTLPIADGYALLRCLSNALGLLGILYPGSASPEACSAWRFVHDARLHVQHIVYALGPGDASWAAHVASGLDEALGDFVSKLRRLVASSSFDHPTALVTAYTAAFEGVFQELLNCWKERERRRRPSPPAPAPPPPPAPFAPPPAAANPGQAMQRLQQKVVGSIKGDTPYCFRYLMGKCKASNCRLSHAPLSAEELTACLRTMAAGVRDVTGGPASA